MNILSFYFGVGFHKMIFWLINTAFINSKKIMQIFKFIFLKNNIDITRQIHHKIRELEYAGLFIISLTLTLYPRVGKGESALAKLIN